MSFKGTIGLIGARGGSKRIPNKNIKLLGRLPLIVYSILTSRASYFIDKTYVSTDSDEIAKISFSYESYITMRPKELAQDDSTDLGWILHFLGEYIKNNSIYPENIVFLRPTSPFRAVFEVDRAISLFKAKNSSLRSLELISEPIEKTFRLNEEGLLIPAYPGLSLDVTNSPSQSFIPSFKANGYVDILRTEYILDSKTLYGERIQSFITDSVIELDTVEEWKLAELYIKEKYDLYSSKD